MTFTPPVVKLIRGALSLSLTSGRYRLSADFLPPEVSILPLLATGTSANRFGGAEKIGERGQVQDWTFNVEITNCASEAEVRQAANSLRNFLVGAGDKNNPTYLYYASSSNVTLDPLWGQRALYYEIVNGKANLGALYGTQALEFGRGLFDCPVTLTIKPWALGQPQRLATATGGILPDQWGTPDGVEKGVIIPEATTNKASNPVFGNATWNTTWTAGANIIASQNTNPQYCLPQTQSSAFLQSNGAANQFYQVINAGGTATHCFSALVMRPDGGAVTSSDCQIYYNAGISTNYIHLGNGLYLLTAATAGINGATNTGILVFSGHSVYLLAYQCEQKVYPTPICWGDLLGCSWSSTAHAAASTSTRTAASCKVTIDDTVLRAAQGTIAWTWIAPNNYNALAATTQYLWWSATGVLCYYDTTTNVAVLADGSGNSNAAMTFTAGDVITFHATWGSTSGLTLYKNGAVLATGTSHVVSALASALWIGTTAAGAGNFNGTFADLRTFPHEMTATEVANDYANTSKASGTVTASAQRTGAIPWFWTLNGDNVTSQYTDATHQHWGVAGGIPGSVEALTDYTILLDTTGSNFDNDGGTYYLAQLPAPNWFSPSVFPMYYDASATSSGSGDIGGSVTYNIIGSPASTAAAVTWQAAQLPKASASYLAGQELTLAARLKDYSANTSNLQIQFQIQLGNTYLSADQKLTSNVAGGSGQNLFFSNPITFPTAKDLYGASQGGFELLYFSLGLQRISGSAASVAVDYIWVMPTIRARVTATGTALGGKQAWSRLRDDRADYEAQNNSYNSPMLFRGRKVNLYPGVYNTLFAMRGDVGLFFDITRTMTFNTIKVTPRYALL
jgi:hypothetical protein